MFAIHVLQHDMKQVEPSSKAQDIFDIKRRSGFGRVAWRRLQRSWAQNIDGSKHLVTIEELRVASVSAIIQLREEGRAKRR